MRPKEQNRTVRRMVRIKRGGKITRTREVEGLFL